MSKVSETTDQAEQEQRLRWGVETHRIPKRCPSCGGKSYKYRDDRVCIGCVMGAEVKRHKFYGVNA